MQKNSRETNRRPPDEFAHPRLHGSQAEEVAALLRSRSTHRPLHRRPASSAINSRSLIGFPCRGPRRVVEEYHILRLRIAWETILSGSIARPDWGSRSPTQRLASPSGFI